MSKSFFCQCGEVYRKQRHLTEHIALLNPHWPRSSDSDEHAQISEQEWLKGGIKAGSTVPWRLFHAPQG